MRIHPVSPTPPSFPRNEPDAVVTKYYEMWTAWYKNTDQGQQEKLTQDLMDYIIDNHDYLQNLADNFPPDRQQPTVAFERSFAHALVALTDYRNDGCRGVKVPPSEFVSDIYKWVNYNQPKEPIWD